MSRYPPPEEWGNDVSPSPSLIGVIVIPALLFVVGALALGASMFGVF